MANYGPLEWIKKRKLQIVLTFLFVSFSAALAAYRTASIDSEDRRGFRCQILVRPNNRRLSESQQSLYNPDWDKTAKIDPSENPFSDEALAPPPLCSREKIQGIIDLRLHPTASLFGSMIPSLLFAPAIYWLVGWFLKRYDAKISKANTPPSSRQIIGDFGELIEASAANAGVIYDISVLPHPKEKILHALMDELRNAQSGEDREFLKVGALLLCQYQFGVGASPIELIPSSIFNQRATAAPDLRREAAAIAEHSERVKPRHDAFDAVVEADIKRVKAMIEAAERF